jgi:hypothetical protein
MTLLSLLSVQKSLTSVFGTFQVKLYHRLFHLDPTIHHPPILVALSDTQVRCTVSRSHLQLLVLKMRPQAFHQQLHVSYSLHPLTSPSVFGPWRPTLASLCTKAMKAQSGMFAGDLSDTTSSVAAGTRPFASGAKITSPTSA